MYLIAYQKRKKNERFTLSDFIYGKVIVVRVDHGSRTKEYRKTLYS